MVQKFMVEKSGVEKFKAEKSGVTRFGVEMSFNYFETFHRACVKVKAINSCVARRRRETIFFPHSDFLEKYFALSRLSI